MNHQIPTKISIIKFSKTVPMHLSYWSLIYNPYLQIALLKSVRLNIILNAGSFQEYHHRGPPSAAPRLQNLVVMVEPLLLGLIPQLTLPPPQLTLPPHQHLVEEELTATHYFPGVLMAVVMGLVMGLVKGGLSLPCDQLGEGEGDRGPIMHHVRHTVKFSSLCSHFFPGGQCATENCS